MSSFLLRNQAEFIDVVLEDEHTHTGVRNRPKHELKRKLRLSLSELSESTSKPKSSTGRIFLVFWNITGVMWHNLCQDSRPFLGALVGWSNL